MIDQIIELAKRLIAVRSEPDNIRALNDALRLAIVNIADYKIENFISNNIPSVLVRNTDARPKRFKLILNAHLDVIAGKPNQYIPIEKNGRLYGVGSMDMKANAACMIFAFFKMASKVDYPLGLQLVTDEETGGLNGTKHQIDKGVRADFAIAGEPTNFDIVTEARGVLQVKISAVGKTAHGAYPWRGVNAVWQMNEFLNILKKRYPLPKQEKWATTINLSSITTDNQVLNKIPDACSVFLDIRFVPEDSGSILENIKDLLPKDFTLDVLIHEPGLMTNIDNKYLKTLENTAQAITKKTTVLRGAFGTSDAQHFASVDCPAVEFGPVGGGIGSDEEWVDINSLDEYYKILIKYLQAL